VIKSIKFGDKRGEHTKLKQNQLMSGFVLSTAADWVLDENGIAITISTLLIVLRNEQWNMLHLIVFSRRRMFPSKIRVREKLRESDHSGHLPPVLT
jgi:hypothetical protein